MPVTTPVVGSTEAVPGEELDHEPPAGVLFSVVVLPRHTKALPVILPGKGYTVTVVVAKHRPTVYVIVAVLAVPTEPPVTTPLDDTDAVVGALLLQIPDGLRLDKAVVEPAHTVGVPVIGNTAALTFTVAVEVVEQEPKVAITVYTVVVAGAAYTVFVGVPAT